MAKVVKMVTSGGQYLVRKWPIAQKYIVAEMTPPSPVAIPQYFKDATKAFQGLSRCREKTVQEGLISCLVFWEVMCWFFVGEAIGRRSIVGYKVPGTYGGGH